MRVEVCRAPGRHAKLKLYRCLRENGLRAHACQVAAMSIGDRLHARGDAITARQNELTPLSRRQPEQKIADYVCKMWISTAGTGNAVLYRGTNDASDLAERFKK